MGVETGFKYTIRIPLDKAESLVMNYDKLCDGYNGPTIKVQSVSDFFKALKLYFGCYKLTVCPKNYDLVVEGEFDAVEYSDFFDTYSDIAKFSRDFQIVDNEYGGHPFYNKYTQQILLNKDNKLYRINIDENGQIYEWGKPTEDYTLDSLKNNYCDEGESDKNVDSKRIDEIYFSGIDKKKVKRNGRISSK
jgi:hypothetical protein